MRNNKNFLAEEKERIEESFTRKIKGLKIQNEVLNILENEIKPYHMKYLNSKHYKEITESLEGFFKPKNIQCVFAKDRAHTKLFIHSKEIGYTSGESQYYFYDILHTFNEKFKTERMDAEKMVKEIKEKIQKNNESIKKLKHEKITLVNIVNTINEKVKEANAVVENLTPFTRGILREERMINSAVYLKYLLS